MESKGAKMILGVYDHFLRGVAKPEVKHWELVAISPSAGVWKNDKSKSYAYAYRGMITPDDIQVVPTLISNKVANTTRYRKDRDFTRKYQPPAGYQRYAFGHSLGGAIVDQIISDGLADSGISFNPAIELNKMEFSKNKRLYNRHDFLYKMIGQHAANVHTINNDLFSRISAGANFFNVALSYYTHNLSQFIDTKQEEPKKAPSEERAKGMIGEPSEEDVSPRSYLIQSVVLDKATFPTIDKAKEWAGLHKYKIDKYDETPTAWRFRQVSPDIFKTGIYQAKTIPLENTGNLIVAYKV